MTINMNLKTSGKICMVLCTKTTPNNHPGKSNVGKTECEQLQTKGYFNKQSLWGTWKALSHAFHPYGALVGSDFNSSVLVELTWATRNIQEKNKNGNCHQKWSCNTGS
jgi:hypothetical protein